jgi:UDP-glucuronate decarboxylase
VTEAEARGSGLTGSGALWLSRSAERIVVVGAGGWLGLASLELLHRRLGDATFRARVVAFGSEARTLTLRDGLQVDQRPIGELPHLSSVPSIVLHLAFLTQEKAKAMSEADYVAANRAISHAVLAALDPIGARGVFVPSSGAVYRVDDSTAQASMRLYGRLKLEDEAAFTGWAGEGDRRAVIARVFNLAGPHINKQSSYALACFIADAVAGRPIEIRATRPVWRSYVAIAELMSVVFGALAEPGPGATLFDTAGDADYEMADIARAVTRAHGAPTGIHRPPMVDGPPDRYLGDGRAYRALRAHLAVAPVEFAIQIAETYRYMAEIAEIH